MQILSEKEFEDILVLHPELIEEGLTLLERQMQIQTRRMDLLFRDKNNQLLIVELKKGPLLEEDINQVEDYKYRIEPTVNSSVRALLIGSSYSEEIGSSCVERNVEVRAIRTPYLFNYLQKHDQPLYEKIFIENKLHEAAKKVSSLSFQDYLNETSPFGVPYTSYQFFKPVDASPELSENNLLNQKVADLVYEKIKELPFDRTLFNDSFQLNRIKDRPAKWVERAKGAWQGYEIDFELRYDGNSDVIPCQVYLGTIGYRGNKNTFADERSRFIVTRVGNGKQRVTTQYGLHKYIRAEKNGLFPFYELKFNAIGLPKKYWESVYSLLDDYGYFVRDSEGKKPTKVVWVGDIQLDDSNASDMIGNLLESLFAVTIVKSQFKGKAENLTFPCFDEYMVDNE